MSQHEKAAQTAPAGEQQTAIAEGDKAPQTSGFVVLLFYAAMAVAYLFYNDRTRPVVTSFLATYRWGVLAALGAVVILLLWKRTRERLGQFTVRGRIALVIFIGAPLL